MNESCPHWRDRLGNIVCFSVAGALIFYVMSPALKKQSFMSADNTWWYGTFQFFVQNMANGVFPLWAPYMHNGEPFYFNMNHFGLLNPLILFPVLVHKVFNVNMFSLFHGYFLFRVFVHVLGILFLLRRLFKDAHAVTLTFCLMMGVVNYGAMFASFFHLDSQALAPWIILFSVRAYQERRTVDFALTGYLLGIHIGTTTYLSLFFCSFIGVFLFFSFLFYRREFLNFIWEERYKVVLSATLVILLSLPLLAIGLDQDTIFPVTRVFGVRQDLSLFLEHRVFNQAYDQLFGHGAYAGHILRPENVIAYLVGRGIGPDTLLSFFVLYALFRCPFKFKIPLILTSICMYFFALAGETPIYYPFFHVVPGFKMIRHTIGFIEVLAIVKAIFGVFGITRFLADHSRTLGREVVFSLILILPLVAQMILRAKFRFLGLYAAPWEHINFSAAVVILALPLIQGFRSRDLRLIVLYGAMIFLVSYTFREFVGYLAPRSDLTGGFNQSDFGKRNISFDSSRIVNKDYDSVLLYEGLILQKNTALSTVLEPAPGKTRQNIEYLKYWKGGHTGNRAIYWPWDYTPLYLLGEENYSLFRDLSGIGRELIRFYPKDRGISLSTAEARRFVSRYYRDEKGAGSNLTDRVLLLENKGTAESRSMERRSMETVAIKALPALSPIEYEVKRFTSNSISIGFRAPTDGYLLYMDTSNPYWESMVNGNKADVIGANIAFKSVNVPEGNNVVEFVYRPWRYIISCLIFLVINIIFASMMIHSVSVRVCAPVISRLPDGRSLVVAQRQ